ncbi:MAG: helix-turn-helix transcriptional regulator [Flavobacteriales bacterium]|nr:helix-turn-helix transcriptional regulator [Flavobacteriales bacterium]MCB9192840.1 helix-turn-helix transcriptional regulator [Flavobacteriales bacterium]
MKTRYYPIAETQLTLAEARAVSLLITGIPRKQVAQLLGIAESTLNQRMRLIYLKLQVQSIGSLVRVALTHGFDDQGHLNGEYLFDGYSGLPWE